MILQNSLIAIFLLSLPTAGFAQRTEGTKGVHDADSTYIRTFIKRNDIRIFYGGQGNRLVLGSLRNGSPDLTKNIYNNNNDFFGIGGTYKWLDGDLSFSLPGTTFLHEERSNLDQFKMSGSYTRRKISYRAYLSDSKGVTVAGNENEYESAPTIHEFRIGFQATYIFNEKKYSYRAALYQSELQMKTGGSFLLRVEPFYRNLGGSGQQIVPEPYDLEDTFGDQVGLTYVKAPGLIFMPGYGVNFAFKKSRMFISPVLLAGAGAALNNYKSDKGKETSFNMEYNAYFLLNAGYNGSLIYARAQCAYSTRYSPIKPSYLASTDFIVSLLAGFRFKDVKRLKH